MSLGNESNLFCEVLCACKHVYDQLGPGFREAQYQRALEHEINSYDHVTVERERTIPLFYKTSKGTQVHIGDGRADLIAKRYCFFDFSLFGFVLLYFLSSRTDDPDIIIEIKIRKNSSDLSQLKRYVRGMNNPMVAGALVYFLDSKVDCIWQP